MLLWASPSFAQAAFDGEPTLTAVISCNAPTISGKTTAGSNRLGVVAIGGTEFAGPPYIGAVTWDGVAMTLVSEVQAGGEFTSLWWIANPPTSGSTIAVSGGCAFGAAVASSYNNVDTSSSPVRSFATYTQSGGTISTAPGSSTANDVVVDSVGVYNAQPISAGANVVRVFDNSSFTQWSAISDQAGNSTPPANAWAGTAPETLWSQVVVSFIGTGGGPPPPTATCLSRALLGVGC